MALTTLATVRLVPGFTSSAVYSDDYLNMVISGVDKAIKTFCKQGLELAQYTQYMSGNNQVDLPLFQLPVKKWLTTVTASSNGAALPVATLNVASTTGFLSAGSVAVQTNVGGQFATVTYTGKTATTLTGCSGGTGTLATGYVVFTPIVYFDPLGAWGSNPNGFADSTILALGTQFSPVMDDDGTTSTRGILRRLGFGGLGGSNPMGWGGFPQWGGGWGKLAATRHVVWPPGDGNLKVVYPAGYDPVPDDLEMAATELTCWMAQTIQNAGMPMQSEGYEGYSYSRALQSLNSNQVPEIGTVRQLLGNYRDIAIGTVA